MADIIPEQILYTRAQAARLLGSSVATVIRLQRAGRLTPIKLTKKAASQVYFRREEILGLVDGAANDAA
jgi:hypothetical protein